MAAATPGTKQDGSNFKVPFTLLKIVEGFNHRIDYGDIEGLAQSIKESGVRVALEGYRDVANNIYYVVAGHRRYAACKLLFEREGIDTEVPFKLEARETTEADRVLTTLLTNDGKPLTPLETAAAVADLIKFGWPVEEIGPKIGKTPLYVSRLNMLNTAPAKFKNLVKKGVLSGTEAIKIVGNNEVEEFLKDYDAGKYNTKGSNGEEEAPKRITAKNIARADSVKTFKILTTKMDKSAIKPDLQAEYDFWVRVMNNQISTQEFYDRFSTVGG